MSAILWRCADCSKWSYAKRRPLHHQRFIPAEQLAEFLSWYSVGDEVRDQRVIRIDEAWADADPDGDESEGGVWVACGPFEEWHAERVASPPAPSQEDGR